MQSCQQAKSDTSYFHQEDAAGRESEHNDG